MTPGVAYDRLWVVDAGGTLYSTAGFEFVQMTPFVERTLRGDRYRRETSRSTPLVATVYDLDFAAEMELLARQGSLVRVFAQGSYQSYIAEPVLPYVDALERSLFDLPSRNVSFFKAGTIDAEYLQTSVLWGKGLAAADLLQYEPALALVDSVAVSAGVATINLSTSGAGGDCGIYVDVFCPIEGQTVRMESAFTDNVGSALWTYGTRVEALDFAKTSTLGSAADSDTGDAAAATFSADLTLPTSTRWLRCYLAYFTATSGAPTGVDAAVRTPQKHQTGTRLIVL